MSDANITLVKALYETYQRGDMDALVAGFTPDAEWYTVGQKEDFPSFGRRKGSNALHDFFRSVAEALDFDEFAAKDFFADKDKVFVLGHYKVTMKKSGRKAASDWVHILTIRNDKVTEFGNSLIRLLWRRPIVVDTFP